jgi:hypothetical protein
VIRLWDRTLQEQITYHLRDGRAPEFDKGGQAVRVRLARHIIDNLILDHMPGALRGQRLKIVELGCGAGDISGPYSNPVVLSGGAPTTPADVHGFDLTQAAADTCARRWPRMTVTIKPVEEIEPIDCDILVLCEFLEHIDDPVSLVKKWLPHAAWVIIGHPLNEPNPPYETGHIWSYSLEDWLGWFELGGHYSWDRFVVPMGPYESMIMGYGSRRTA